MGSKEGPAAKHAKTTVSGRRGEKGGAGIRGTRRKRRLYGD